LPRTVAFAGAVVLTLWCVVRALMVDALAGPLEGVEFESASQPLIQGDRIQGYLAKPASGKATIPPPGSRPSAVMASSISASLRTGIVIGSTSRDRAAASNKGRKNDPPPGASSGF